MRKTLPFILLVACAGHSQSTAPAPRQAVYDENEYRSYQVPGSGSIGGQVFRTTRSGEVRYGAGSPVVLNPVTSYSTEWWHRAIYGNETLDKVDPRAFKTFHQVTADGEGRFRFDSLPPGRYFIASTVTWEYYAGQYAGNQETGGKVGQRVRLLPGQSVSLILNSLKDF